MMYRMFPYYTNVFRLTVSFQAGKFYQKTVYMFIWLTSILRTKTINLYHVLGPISCIAMVTYDGSIWQVDMKKSSGPPPFLCLLSSLLIAGFAITFKNADDFKVICTTAHSKVAGVWAVEHGVHYQVNWRQWIWRQIYDIQNFSNIAAAQHWFWLLTYLQ